MAKWTLDRSLEEMTGTGVVAVVRAPDSTKLVEVARALCEGGVTCVEITMTTPNALEVIHAAVGHLGDRACIGVGTVLDSETARAAILAGAEFVVSPILDEEVIRTAHRYSKPVVPGAFTPTEIVRAWEAGADVVKVFPASVGGPSYFRALKGPLPHIKLTPTGGVNLTTAAEFIRAGAEFLAVGGELVTKEDIAGGNYESLRDRAGQYVQVVKQARSR
ncbi:bifunctional 4-hydroxy-2-oxoglutarate aldolase/2-dehydro-3-deoxy-phosphogluconate aldolase [Candidatus Sumerlaeota bacterium]|nr:bifunctional 4-hydroxy-2-oxoglutarate aldolase/2-dehydro-3-deoxy-phosphogluconate aldolase [Candidatus Sumerlaeota bacterium]